MRKKQLEEMRFLLTEFCSVHRLRLANTFGPRCATWRGRAAPRGEAVLDYIGISASDQFDSGTTAEWIRAPGRSATIQEISDHKLVHLAVAVGRRRRCKNRKRAALHQWEPVDPAAAAASFDRALSRQFQDAGSRYRPLQSLVEEEEEEEDIKRDVRPVKEEEGDQRRQGRGTLSQIIADTAASIPSRQVAALRAPVRPERLWTLERLLRRALWPRELRCQNEVRSLRRLIKPLRKQYDADMLEYKHKVEQRKLRTQAQALKVKKMTGEWELTYDVEAKQVEIGRYLKDRVEDYGARREVQSILEGLASKLNQSQCVSITMHDILRARARLKSGAAGPDQVTREMLQLIPFASLKTIRHHFSLIANRRQQVPSDWKRFLVTLIPKAPSIQELSETRAICLLSLVQKWYNHVLVIKGEQHLVNIKHSLNMYGFVQFRKVSEVTSFTKHLCQHAAQWGKGEKLYLASLDVLQAFDHVTIKLALQSMEKLGFDPALIYALLCPMTENTCKATFEGTQNLDWIGWDRSIRTGGVDGPFIFKVVSVALWNDIVGTWPGRDLGYVVESPVPMPTRSTISHALWADNLLLYARDERQLRTMVTELTLPLLQAGLNWKPSSLKLIPFGVNGSNDVVLDIQLPTQTHTYKLECVNTLDILGYRLDRYWTQHSDLQFNLDRARGAFFADIEYYRSHRIPIERRFQRYRLRIQSKLLFAIEGMTIDNITAQKIFSWEGKLLAIIGGRRKGVTEDWTVYQKRRFKYARDQFANHGFLSAVELFIHKNWLWAKDIACFARGFACQNIPTAALHTDRVHVDPTASLHTYSQAHTHVHSSLPVPQLSGQRSLESAPSFIQTATLHTHSDDITHVHSLLPVPQVDDRSFDTLPSYIQTATLHTNSGEHAHLRSMSSVPQAERGSSFDQLPCYIPTATLHTHSTHFIHSHCPPRALPQSVSPEPQRPAAMFGSRGGLTEHKKDCQRSSGRVSSASSIRVSLEPNKKDAHCSSGRVSSASRIRVPLSDPLQVAHLFECARLLEERSSQREAQGTASPVATALPVDGESEPTPAAKNRRRQIVETRLAARGEKRCPGPSLTASQEELAKRVRQPQRPCDKRDRDEICSPRGSQKRRCIAQVNDDPIASADSLSAAPQGSKRPRDPPSSNHDSEPREARPSGANVNVFKLNAYSQARLGMMHASGDWAAHRRAFAARSRDSQAALLGWRGGTKYVGWRKWEDVFIADQNGNTKWWETMMFGKEDWSIFVEKLLKRLHLPAILDYLAKPRVSVARTEEEETKVNNDRIARRIAHNFENETIFDYESDKIPFEILGDSLCVVQWIRGHWRCTNMGYNNTLEAAQNTLDAITDTCLRTACAGADPIKHLYREGNSYADELTWACRACPHTSKRNEYLAPLYTSKVLGLRGYFDGGTSDIGAGGGWWLQAFVEHKNAIQCHVIAEEAFGLDRESTVTVCELTAASKLIHAISQIASVIDSVSHAR